MGVIHSSLVNPGWFIQGLFFWNVEFLFNRVHIKQAYHKNLAQAGSRVAEIILPDILCEEFHKAMLRSKNGYNGVKHVS
jgi:hypothetical protein